MEEVNKEIFKIENLNLYYGEKHALNLPKNIGHIFIEFYRK